MPRSSRLSRRQSLRAAAVLLLAQLAAACVKTAPGGPRPAPVPAPEPTLAGEPASAPVSRDAAIEYLSTRKLIVPVAGAPLSKIMNSFDEERDGGRRKHRAVDILAPRGTPVLAADDGFVLRVSYNRLGGNTVYAVDPTRRIVYYYAHLAGYFPGLTAGMPIFKGDTLGYVGTTGNAPENLPHLHFQVMRMPADPHRYWDGDPVDPYPLLAGAERAKAAEHAGGQ